DAVSLGFELGFAHLFSLNGGYNFHSDLMNKFTLGGTIRLDDFRSSRNTLLPGRNKALKLEIATIDEGEFFSRTYRGGLNHLPVRPEHFKFVAPAQGDTVTSQRVTLKWQPSRDPDIFDSVGYTLLISNSKARLEELIDLYEQDIDLFFTALKDSASDIVAASQTPDNLHQLTKLQSGHHYWAVFAQDENQHLRFARRGRSPIAHFFVPSPDLEIRDVKFKHSPWITVDDHHGEIEITIANNGSIAASDFAVTISDSVLPGYQIQSGRSVEFEKKIIHQFNIDNLEAGELKIITIPWHTVYLGGHVFSCVVDADNVIDEANKENNVAEKIFYTIPKGYFSTDDSVSIVEVQFSSI
ncbi:MAG: CARDB domain-containing protein, partial [bacterium]|nr:CARDB domain-containing protein [bacterium]